VEQMETLPLERVAAELMDRLGALLGEVR
jgi:phosphopantothenoylcysteine decarboxylase/phosphopantothenate--cysteine ligase